MKRLTGYIIEKYSCMTGAYTCNRLVEEAGKRGIDLQIIGIADVTIGSSEAEHLEGDQGSVVYYKGQPLAPCDFIINRYKYGHLKDAIGKLAKRTYNDTDIFNVYINKYMQVCHLQSEAFYMPKFMLGTAMTDFAQIVEVLGVPFVAKGLESAQGAEIFLISSEEDLRLLGQQYSADKEYLFEEYISTSYGRDIRFYSIRGQVIACMTREAVSGFKANVALGAQVRAYPIDAGIRQTAKDIYEQTGLDFLGIDLLFGKDKPYFCEINVMPGIEGMERATGVNVAGAIIDTIWEDFHLEDYVYASYLKAEPYLDYHAPDSQKRNPAFSKDIIVKRAGKPTALVTGSKGKGSVAKMIAEIMGVHRKTGLMTSPHILEFRERFQIQGEPVSEKALNLAIMRVKPEFDAVEQTLSTGEYISPMGIQTAAALELFGTADVDFQVMECGKGVAYDDVNQVPHEYGVINRIFLEHTRELGSALKEIAENKAAIMTGCVTAGQEKRQVIFTAKQEPEVMEVLTIRAQEKDCELRVYGKDFWCENIMFTRQGMCFDVVTTNNCYEGLQIPLLGTYQAENCALAVALCEEVLGALKLSKVKEALKWLEWPGRLEILSGAPLTILDACINRYSSQNVLEALKRLQIPKANIILGIPMDKDYLGVAQAMQAVAGRMILTRSSNPHYKFGKEQLQALQEAGIEAQWADGIAEALELARTPLEQISPKDGKCTEAGARPEEVTDIPICILGTTSLIADVKKMAATPCPL